MSIIARGRYDRPEVQVIGIVTKDGSIKEILTPRKKLNAEDFREFKTHVFREGVDELSSIAFDFYGDSTKFYIIGEVNNIIDPAVIPANTRLLVPTPRELNRLGL